MRLKSMLELNQNILIHIYCFLSRYCTVTLPKHLYLGNEHILVPTFKTNQNISTYPQIIYCLCFTVAHQFLIICWIKSKMVLKYKIWKYITL